MFRFSRAAAHMSLAASLFCLAGAASAAFISLDPRATYLRVNEYKYANQFSAGGLPLDATAYSLAALGFAPGEEVFIQRSGDYLPTQFMLSDGSMPTDSSNSLLALFSSTDVLLEPTLSGEGLYEILTSVEFRVPGAISSSRPQRVSNPTRIGGLSTDIPEDFNVNTTTSPVKVTIPVGAAYIFFSPSDTRFGDNTDPDGDFGVNIWAVNPKPVPLPDSLLLAGSAFVLLGASRRIKR